MMCQIKYISWFLQSAWQLLEKNWQSNKHLGIWRNLNNLVKFNTSLPYLMLYWFFFSMQLCRKLLASILQVTGEKSELFQEVIFLPSIIYHILQICLDCCTVQQITNSKFYLLFPLFMQCLYLDMAVSFKFAKLFAY